VAGCCALGREGKKENMDHEEPVLLPGEMNAKNVWLGRLALVLCSTVLSSFISVTAVSIGWKASIDTLNAVDQVKLTEHEEKIKQLDREAVRTGDLIYRDQLLDAKLSAINIQILELKDQISSLHPAREVR
jgi:hypothetical protein